MTNKGERTRNDIVDRAFALATHVGFESLTLGVLAEELQISKGGLLGHFKSKQPLQLAVLYRATAAFIDEVMLPALKEARGEPRVWALFERYLAWLRGKRDRRGCLFLQLSVEYDDRPGAIRAAIKRNQ